MSGPNGYTTYETMNLLVPAFGNTRCLRVDFPFNSSNIFDFKQVVIEDVPFIPQSVTVDASDVAEGEQVVFTVAQIGFKRIIMGGQNVTFNFPSINNLKVSVTASDGISPVRCFFYNYPAFVDMQGPQLVTQNSQSGQDVNIISPNPLPVTIEGGDLSGAIPPMNRQSTLVNITGSLLTTNTTIIDLSTGSNRVTLYGLSIFGVITSDVDTRIDIKATFTPPANVISIPLIAGKETLINIQYNPTTALQLANSGTSLVYAGSVAATLTGVLSIVSSFTRVPAVV